MLFRSLQLGISMMVPVGLCFFLGYKLDQWLSTRYFVMVFLFLGFAAGFRSVYMITKGFYAKDLEREKKEQEYFADLYRHSKKVKEDEDNSDD